MTPSQTTRIINWIALPVALVALVLVGYHVYQRHFTHEQAGLQYQFDDLPTMDTAPVTADIDAIIQKHVFGVKPTAARPVPKPVAQKPKPKPAPKTRLNIKLTGVIDGSSPENGLAILEIERGRTLVIAVGEKIGDTDAVLHQVLPGEVLIDRGGTIESVKMVRKTLSIASLDPSLSSNLPQPHTERGRPSPTNNLPQPYIERGDKPGNGETDYSSSIPRAVPRSLPSSSYQSGSNISEAARSRQLVRYPNRRGFQSNEDEDEDESEDGEGARLPIPRALRN